MTVNEAKEFSIWPPKAMMAVGNSEALRTQLMMLLVSVIWFCLPRSSVSNPLIVYFGGVAQHLRLSRYSLCEVLFKININWRFRYQLSQTTCLVIRLDNTLYTPGPCCSKQD